MKETPTICGYDWVEVMCLQESTFGTTPTSGTWNHIYLPKKVSVKPKIRALQEVLGFGVQNPSDWTPTKEQAEATLEHILTAKSASPAFEWTDLVKFICGESMNLTIENHLKSFSLGAKADLTTDRFLWLKGCKIKGYEISGKAEGDTRLLGKVDILAQYGTEGTTDYVSGTASRATAPAKTPILMSDCDVKYGAASSEASILSKLNSFAFKFERELKPVGCDSTNKLLYASIEEQRRAFSCDLTIDFQDFSEYDDFISNNQRNVILEIPTGTGGRRLTLGSGRIVNPPVEISEIDLLALKLTLNFATLTIATIS